MDSLFFINIGIPKTINIPKTKMEDAPLSHKTSPAKTNIQNIIENIDSVYALIFSLVVFFHFPINFTKAMQHTKYMYKNMLTEMLKSFIKLSLSESDC